MPAVTTLVRARPLPTACRQTIDVSETHRTTADVVPPARAATDRDASCCELAISVTLTAPDVGAFVCTTWEIRVTSNDIANVKLARALTFVTTAFAAPL